MEESTSLSAGTTAGHHLDTSHAGTSPDRQGAASNQRTAWPLASVILGLALLASLVAFWLMRSLREMPREAFRQGREALKELRSVAEAFRTGTVSTSFSSYATEVSGGTRLQFATLRQMEVFERRDSAAVLWGQFALPDVVVEARAPVEYTYYLDLEKPWTFRLQGNEVLVSVPAIEFNAPAVDASALRFQVREGSVFRDEELVRQKLQEALTGLVKMKAHQNVGLVREVGRRKTEQFVESWLAQRFDTEGGRLRARVTFANEPGAPAAPVAPAAVATPRP
jgi:hypothetical protein